MLTMVISRNEIKAATVLRQISYSTDDSDIIFISKHVDLNQFKASLHDPVPHSPSYIRPRKYFSFF